MEIKKVMNNSLVLVVDDKQNDFIAVGKGIGFQKKPGNKIDIEKVEKFCVLEEKIPIKQFLDMMSAIPEEYINITNKAISYAEKTLDEKLGSQLFIALLDHISFAIERFNKNIAIQNRLYYQVKKFYPLEFSIGEYVLEMINTEVKVNLPNHEAANIAFHIINARTDEKNMQHTTLCVALQKDIMNIIKYHFNNQVDENELNYLRFLTHLQFFFERVIGGKMLKTNEQEILEAMATKHTYSYDCVLKIKEYLFKQLGEEITKDEMLYLLIYLVRIFE